MIYGWARRVVPKVDELMGDDDQMTEEQINDKDNQTALFGHIAEKVCKALEQFQEEPEQKTNLMNDFLTDDFVNKNIRVRPASGKTQEEHKEMRSFNSRAHINNDV